MKLKCNGKKIEIKKATNFTTRLIGLMGKKDIKYGILFPKCNAIHTFFMKSEIDVIGINEENQIIYIYRNVPKNKIVRIKDDAKKTSILEIPKNASKSFVIGSVITWEE